MTQQGINNLPAGLRHISLPACQQQSCGRGVVKRSGGLRRRLPHRLRRRRRQDLPQQRSRRVEPRAPQQANRGYPLLDGRGGTRGLPARPRQQRRQLEVLRHLAGGGLHSLVGIIDHRADVPFDRWVLPFEAAFELQPRRHPRQPGATPGWVGESEVGCQQSHSAGHLGGIPPRANDAAQIAHEPLLAFGGRLEKLLVEVAEQGKRRHRRSTRCGQAKPRALGMTRDDFRQGAERPSVVGQVAEAKRNLKLHFRRRVVSQSHDGSGQLRDETLGKADGILAHPRVWIIKRRRYQTRIERRQAFERPQRVQPRLRRGPLANQLLEFRDSRGVFAVDQQPLRSSPMPGIRVRQHPNQRLRPQSAEVHL